ncbi:response regulator [Rhodocytophaga aerolata]|uniref:Response regulator n=1 Tax=Rhodocytophaga aerolata TaxID=455078 RepID=A0ABT8RJB3_9BACT|nr:response regulator [Rhodocytophaga aerolata]MDO1451333.1 response regulator [Rhodocytophaga aerolata]
MKKLKTILLVDDDQVNNYLNKIILQELAIAETIHIASNGKIALAYLLEHCESTSRICPELIIFDHQMPVMDGMELIKSLQANDFINRKEVVFILLGIHTKAEDIKKFQELGVQEFTTKPLSKETVMEVYHKYWAGDTAQDHTCVS